MNKQAKIWIGLGMGLMLALACERAERLKPVAVDRLPAISQIRPDSNAFLLRPGAVVAVGFRAADPEGLRSFRVERRVYDPAGTEVEGATVRLEQSLSGTTALVDFIDTVGNYPGLYTLRFDAIVEDLEGASAQAIFYVSLRSEDDPEGRYKLFSYTDQRLYSQTKGSEFAFSFTRQQLYPPPDTNRLDWEIAETSAGDTFLAQLVSPANQLVGNDSVFVLRGPEQFDFERATFTSLSQAWWAGNPVSEQSSSLKAGDLLLIRLSKQPNPQFAVMKIREVVDQDGAEGDYLHFDFKVSSE